MAVLIGLIVGALIGGVAFGSAGAAIGGFVGFFVGAVIASRRERDVHRRPDEHVAALPVSAPATEDSLEQKMVALERR
ncbi:MAG TPA: glycine zipper domain-containing protein, partial [Casimicrobiaceae bacterium]